MIARDLFTEEHQLFREAVRDFYQKEIVPYHDEWEKAGCVSKEAWLKAGQNGFLCTLIPEQYGGSGLDFRYSVILTEELMKTGCSGPSFGLHSDVIAPYVWHLGNEDQKNTWLPGMASGEVIGAIAMTEPGAGSDLKGIKSTAVKQGDHYILNGSKTFITNGFMCDLAIVAAKTDPNAGARGISLFLVDPNSKGFTKGNPLPKIGLKAQDTCELFFDNVEVPAENLLGEENKGFYHLMNELSQERLLVSVISISIAQAALQETIKYTKERMAFGKSIADFQNTRFKIAEMATKIQMGQVFVDQCTTLHIKGQLDTPTASMAKCAASDLLCEVVDECLQLHGGYGYVWEYFIAKAYADARVQKIYAGSNEIMKEVIARKIFENS